MNLILEGGLSAAAAYLGIKLIAMSLPPILPKRKSKPNAVRYLTEEDMRTYVPSAVYQEATSRLLHELTDLRKEITRTRAQMALLKVEIQEIRTHTEEQPKKRILEV